MVFYDVDSQVAHETIAFAEGECVQYSEEFVSGAADGAYVCHLTITATGFELRAGGPVAAVAVATPVAIAPAAALAGPAPGMPSVRLMSRSMAVGGQAASPPVAASGSQ